MEDRRSLLFCSSYSLSLFNTRLTFFYPEYFLAIVSYTLEASVCFNHVCFGNYAALTSERRMKLNSRTSCVFNISFYYSYTSNKFEVPNVHLHLKTILL